MVLEDSPFSVAVLSLFHVKVKERCFFKNKLLSPEGLAQNFMGKHLFGNQLFIGAGSL